MRPDNTRGVLLEHLHDHNPWWEQDADAFTLPARPKSDFYHLARPHEPGSQLEDQPLLALVGRHGVGKSTLLHQFINHRIQAGAAPEQFLYIPFDDNPLYQLQSADQLRDTIRYYESRILGRADNPTPQFLILDDIHRIEHPTKPNSTGWGRPISDLIDTPDRYLILTASAGVQITRELDRVSIDPSGYDIQPILSEKFRDYIYHLYPALERDDQRISPTPFRDGPASLPHSIDTGNVEPLVEELRAQYARIANDTRRIQSQLADYLAMGGVLSYAHDGIIESANALSPEDYNRLRTDVRTALYQDVPGFETIQTIADLERLCALAARDCAADPIRYQRLVELFDVDRRTITDSYLPALSALYLLDGVTEYDNSRPRAVRLYLRDTGLITALADGDPTRALSDFDREAALARVAAYDHTMRFVYGINATQGRDSPPTVHYWTGRNGDVDYVFEIDNTPIPVGVAYRPPVDETTHALQEFLDSYDTSIGFRLVGDTVSTTQPITYDDAIIQLPYWFYLLIC